MKIIGVAASKGFTLANIYKPNDKLLKIDDHKVKNIDKEINIFHNALKRSTDELKLLQKKAKRNVLIKKLEVFSSHIHIVNDPNMIIEVEKLIRENKLNSASAYKIVMDQYIEKFKSLDNNYMKERATDIVDVYQLVIRNIIQKELSVKIDIKEGYILLLKDITPSMVLSLDIKKLKGIILKNGGITSHSSLMIRSFGIPLIIGVKEQYDLFKNEDLVIMNGETGLIILEPNKTEIDDYKKQDKLRKTNYENLDKFAFKKAITRDGFPIKIMANISSENDLKIALKNQAEGIGLFRSEYMFLNAKNIPTEEEMYLVYKMVLDSFPNDKVVIRTFDIGGDKIPRHFSLKNQSILRGLPLALSNKNVFEAQIRALLRANDLGNLVILLPMVGSLENLEETIILLNKAIKKYKVDTLVNTKFELGIMVEEKEVTKQISQYSTKVDLFSIGTNDLVESIYQLNRTHETNLHQKAYLSEDFFTRIKAILDEGNLSKIPVSICGEMASDLQAIPSLIKLGFNCLSVDPNLLPEIRQLICKIKKD